MARAHVRPRSAPQPSTPVARTGLFALLLVTATVLAYAGSFRGPFVFDDLLAIVGNPTLAHLGTAWMPPASGLPVSGRPLVNVSFAVNHALGGLSVPGYHAVNLLLHVVAGLLLFGVLRRTFASPPLAGKMGGRAEPLAAGISLLWLLHPLQTEPVAYLSQRAELMAGATYLLTLYAFCRSVEVGASRGWKIVAVVACLLGMACKEIMVTAPLTVLLYDRVFVADSWRTIRTRRFGFYLALALTWLPLAWLVAHTGDRGGTAGFGVAVGWREYALTQFSAILHYLRLSVVPYPLVFDYGRALATGVAQIAVPAVVVLALVAASVFAWRRRPALSFAGLAFFILLAPTSSVVPIATQTIAEHRMYLPLAVVLSVVGVSLAALRPRLAAPLLGVLALGAGVMTFARTQDYCSALVLWEDTAKQRAQNPRAHYNYGNELLDAGRVEEARAQFAETIRLMPGLAEAHNNLGNALVRLNRPDEAAVSYERALALYPAFLEAHNNLGYVRLQQNQPVEAEKQFRLVVAQAPQRAQAHASLADTLAQLGRGAEANDEYERALQLSPADANLHCNFGNLLASEGRFADAIAHYERAVELDPALLPAQCNLGNALLQTRRVAEAIPHLEAALRIDPNLPAIRQNLERAKQWQAANGRTNPVNR